MYNTLRSWKTKKLPWGYVAIILNEAKAEEPWKTKSRINFAFKKFCMKRNVEKKELLDSSNSVATINKPCNSGRPKGSTIVNQYHHKETLIAAKNEMFALYQNEKEEQKKNGTRMHLQWEESPNHGDIATIREHYPHHLEGCPCHHGPSPTIWEIFDSKAFPTIRWPPQ